MQATKKGDEHESDILLVSYQNLNDFLCKFIDHSLPIYNYSVRARVKPEIISDLFISRYRSKFYESIIFWL